MAFLFPNGYLKNSWSLLAACWENVSEEKAVDKAVYLCPLQKCTSGFQDSETILFDTIMVDIYICPKLQNVHHHPG